MTLSLISAIGKSNEIGMKNTLLWDLPADMKHFRETTSGKTVIMGQKTFESLNRPLPNRRNIVITLDKDFKADGVEIVYSVPEVMEKLRTSPQPSPYKGEGEEVFIIGGGQIYKLFIDIADKLYITHVDASFPEADVFFPEIKKEMWKKVKSVQYPKDEKNIYDLEFAEYTKVETLTK